MPYRRMIEARLAEMGLAGVVDARHVEAWMRNERPTFDALAPAEFLALTDCAIGIAVDAPVGMSEDLAGAMGLVDEVAA